MIIVVDFGSQTAHLISRRINEMGADARLILPENVLEKIQEKDVKGIIFSGGPASVYEKNAPVIDKKVFELGIPILGICYGQQLTAYLLGGKIIPGLKKEFGPAEIKITKQSSIFSHLPSHFQVWMTHGDKVDKIPPAFKKIGQTENVFNAAMSDDKNKIYGILFHPEVIHTQFGEQILKNFLEICKVKIKKTAINQKLVENLIKDIKDSVKNEKVVCALSGGVDSSVAAVLTHKAIANNLTCIHIDSGLMREGETENLSKVFEKHYSMQIKIVNADKLFLERLKNIFDPERKRKIIGKTFIDVLEKEAKKIGAKFLVQGTIYPDVIESSGTKHSDKIKSHHNVGGLPEKMKLILVEPLRNFYKDEVREIGKILNLPAEILQRHPFPGPGLAVRIVGEVTEHKLELVRKADRIIQEELQSAKLDKKVWQAFAVYPGIKTTGVRGDSRAYGETIAIRVIEAKDAMTVRWARLPYDLLDRISTRIVNEVKDVNRVVYDITNKPPATIEWE